MVMFQNFKGLFPVTANLIVLLLFLTSCGSGIWDPGDARKVDPNVEVRARKAIEEGRAVSADKLITGTGRGGAFEFASSNPMWRATLETLDFLPLSNVDYSGGIIITDWYSEGTTTNEYIKKFVIKFKIAVSKKLPLLWKRK